MHVCLACSIKVFQISYVRKQPFSTYVFEQLENIFPQELLARIFEEFRPFGFEILTTVSDHIGEYLPIDGYWIPLKIT